MRSFTLCRTGRIFQFSKSIHLSSSKVCRLCWLFQLRRWKKQEDSHGFAFSHAYSRFFQSPETCGRKRVCHAPCHANPPQFSARLLLDFTMESDSPFPVPLSLVNVVTVPSGVMASDASPAPATPHHLHCLTEFLVPCAL